MNRPISDNPSQKHDLIGARIVEWVVENRRLAVFLTRLLGAAGWETREMLLDSEFMDRVEAGLPLIREHVGLPDRYHASVPVALAQLDGIANDLAGTKFFVNNPTRLVLADIIVGHRSGLATLARVMSARRGRTFATEIGVPYRHGIVHGKDLGYANKRVSAKSLAALLALGSWGLERDCDELDAEPPLAPFDPNRVGLKDLAWAWRGAAGTLLRLWFGRSNR